MTNKERNLWIDNDEGLYNWLKSSKLTKTEFVTQYKDEIDKIIEQVLRGTKPAHYLAYSTKTTGIPSIKTTSDFQNPFLKGIIK